MGHNLPRRRLGAFLDKMARKSAPPKPAGIHHHTVKAIGAARHHSLKGRPPGADPDRSVAFARQYGVPTSSGSENQNSVDGGMESGGHRDHWKLPTSSATIGRRRFGGRNAYPTAFVCQLAPDGSFFQHTDSRRAERKR